jgi:acetyl esterase/lipase
MTATETPLRYDPEARLAVTYRDVEYQPGLLARIYQPEGTGPFPAMVSVHGGAWEGKEWLQNEQSHITLAEGGLVVMAIQFRTSMDAPHPAAQQDISYAIRWLKAHASEFNASSDRIGGAGWSSGGHQIMLAGMKPHAYEDIPLAEAPDMHSSLAYVIMGWPVIDPLARYRLAQEKGNVELQGRHNRYFGDEAGMEAASPPAMIARGERVDTPPALLLQGSADEGLPKGMAERFVELYSERGAIIELGKYPGEPHGFMRNDNENTRAAFRLAKSFIARHLYKA